MEDPLKKYNATSRFWYNREVALARIIEDESTLKGAPPHVRNNRELILEAIPHNPWVLVHASETLRNDRSLILVAINYLPNCQWYILCTFFH